jgi:Zn-dependent membrane protease YugP
METLEPRPGVVVQGETPVDVPMTLTTWIPLLAACALPSLATTLLGFVQHVRERRDDGPQLQDPAGRWLKDTVARRGDTVRVEVHPHSGMDAYFPGTGAIGLSRRTYGSHGAVAYAVAAHEHGHAQNMASSEATSRWLADLLPTARLVRTFAFRAFAAGLIGGALFSEVWLLVFAAGMQVLSLAAGAVILADEGMASRRGLELLEGDRFVPRAVLPVARRSMGGAFSVYAGAVAAELLVLLSMPWLAELALAPVAPPTFGAPTVWAPAVWAYVVFVPLLGLRAAHVLHRVFRPEPVQSDFRLFTVMHRESQWEFLAGTCVLMLVAGLHGAGEGAWFQLSTVLATSTAVGPVGALVRALFLVPVVLGLLWAGLLQESDDDVVVLPEAREADAAPALMALYSDPPWYLRVSWVTHVAYLPLLVLLAAELSSR